MLVDQPSNVFSVEKGKLDEFTIDRDLIDLECLQNVMIELFDA